MTVAGVARFAGELDAGASGPERYSVSSVDVFDLESLMVNQVAAWPYCESTALRSNRVQQSHRHKIVATATIQMTAMRWLPFVGAGWKQGQHVSWCELHERSLVQKLFCYVGDRFHELHKRPCPSPRSFLPMTVVGCVLPRRLVMLVLRDVLPHPLAASGRVLLVHSTQQSYEPKRKRQPCAAAPKCAAPGVPGKSTRFQSLSVLARSIRSITRSTSLG